MADRRVLLTGGVLATRNPLTGRVGPEIMPSGLNQDTQLALASLAAPQGTGADLLLPGHGEPGGRRFGRAVKQAKAAGRS